MAEKEPRSVVPHMRLDELLAELQTRLEAVLATRDRVQSLLEAVVSVGSDLDLETVLRRIVETATTLVNASYGALGVIGEENTLIQFVPIGLSEEEIARIEHWPHGLGLLGLLIKEPQTLRLAHICDHPDSYGFPPGHPEMGSFLGVPLRVRDEVFGNLYLTEKRGGGEFDEEDEAIVVALATAAGVAIENARLFEETRRRETWLQASRRTIGGYADRRSVIVMRAEQISGRRTAVGGEGAARRAVPTRSEAGTARPRSSSWTLQETPGFSPGEEWRARSGRQGPGGVVTSCFPHRRSLRLVWFWCSGGRAIPKPVCPGLPPGWRDVKPVEAT